ncbi:MAG: transketolase family protein [Anaerotruncus sp.]|nr:transketolase family protein [Anaerotruncus sp.]
MIANRIAYGEALVELARENPNIVVLDADACKSTGTLCCREQVPENFIQCGIAEQNMMGIAAGLALQGKIPFSTTFSVFTCMRAVEQVRNAICYANVNANIVGTHSGLETGADGGTHQGIEDIAIMRVLPNMTVFAPSTPICTRFLTRSMAAHPGPSYMRLGKDPTPELYQEGEIFPIGGSKLLRQGNDLTIFACGNMVWRALEAAQLLAADGIEARVLDLYSIKPIDQQAIIKAAQETSGLVTVEDHSIIGGLGGAVAEVLCEFAPAKLLRMGLLDVFGRSGVPDRLYELYHLTPADIAQNCKRLMQG